MTWPAHYKFRVQSYLSALAELNDTAVKHEYRQVFHSLPKSVDKKRLPLLIAMKRAADDLRRLNRSDSIPADVKAMLSLMKERDRV